jgi:HEAT repeat protein
LNTETITLLIEQAKNELLEEYSHWDSISQLRNSASTEVFARMAELLHHNDPLYRRLAAITLGQFGPVVNSTLQKQFPDESTDLLLAALKIETDEEVLEDFISALGHLNDPRAVSALVAFREHPKITVRFTLATALWGFDDAASLETLLILMKDADALVRDWATAGLGCRLPEEDSPEVRAALWTNAHDPDEYTRYEALQGLAILRDHRAIPLILDFLSNLNEVKPYSSNEILAMLRDLKDEIQDDRLGPLLAAYPPD